MEGGRGRLMTPVRRKMAEYFTENEKRERCWLRREIIKPLGTNGEREKERKKKKERKKE